MEKNAQSEFRDLCRFFAGRTVADFPGEAIEKAAHVLADTLGVVVAGSKSGEVASFTDKLVRMGGHGKEGDATCPGRREVLDPLKATLINGMAGSSLEFEEGNFGAGGHPAVQIVPAVTALCESRGFTLGRLLASLICGYEIGARIGGAVSLRRGLHPNGSWGTVGAALGAGCGCGLSGDDLVALGNIASSFAVSAYVKNSFTGRTIASSFAGMANHCGLLSLLMFESGILPDEKCFEMTFTRFVSEGIRPEALTRDLGSSFLIVHNYVKPYPTCRFTHPALDALERILGEHPVGPGDVDSIQVESFRAAAYSSGAAPENEGAMKFSLPHLLAARLVLGPLSLETFREDPHQMDAVRDLAGKVEMKISSSYEDMLPEHTPARLVLRLGDGREFSSEVLDSLGSYEEPLPKELLRKKFLALTRPALGKDAPRVFWERIDALDMETDVRELMALLRP